MQKPQRRCIAFHPLLKLFEKTFTPASFAKPFLESQTNITQKTQSAFSTKRKSVRGYIHMSWLLISANRIKGYRGSSREGEERLPLPSMPDGPSAVAIPLLFAAESRLFPLVGTRKVADVRHVFAELITQRPRADTPVSAATKRRRQPVARATPTECLITTQGGGAALALGWASLVTRASRSRLILYN
ncbi:hypothetical protein ACJJTC_003107 [Scirpophaga incertulas]